MHTVVTAESDVADAVYGRAVQLVNQVARFALYL